MSIDLKWNDSYSVNDKNLDDQHKKLFMIVNSLPDKLDKDHARQIVLQLFAYTWEHFDTEERRMSETGYPELPRHKKIHEALLRQLSQIACENFPDNKALSDFKEFASNWLSQHVLKEDLDYATFIQAE